jgi:TetR/AcrR family transcriptional regulator, fatty acid metabolism regulator protein
LIAHESRSFFSKKALTGWRARVTNLNESSFITVAVAPGRANRDISIVKKDNKRSSDKHRRIIEAAVKVFAKNGFYNSKVSEIARTANVADGTIYLYFQNKDDILIRLFEEEMASVLSRMTEEVNKESDPAKKLQRFAFVHLHLVEENQELAEIIQVETRQSSKFMKEYKNPQFQQYLNLISSIIREGQAQGVFRAEIEPGVFKRAFFGALDEMSRYWVLSTARKYSISKAAEEISSFFLDGVLRPTEAEA